MLTLRTLTTPAHGAPMRYTQLRHAARLRNAHDPRALLSLVDAHSAGRLLSVSPAWLLALARAGKIPHYQLGAYVRFDAYELGSWLDGCRRLPAREDHRAGPSGTGG
ncbi:MAG TPA: helix-turn-helix domain-containing protein [Solirubrobacteraceae bacterium]